MFSHYDEFRISNIDTDEQNIVQKYLKPCPLRRSLKSREMHALCEDTFGIQT